MRGNSDIFMCYKRQTLLDFDFGLLACVVLDTAFCYIGVVSDDKQIIGNMNLVGCVLFPDEITLASLSLIFILRDTTQALGSVFVAFAASPFLVLQVPLFKEFRSCTLFEFVPSKL